MIINYLFDNSLIFYGILASTTVFIGYSFYKYNSIWNNSRNTTEIDNINPDIIATSFDDLDMDFDNIESWWDEFYAEYLEQTTPRSVTSGLTMEEHKLNKLNEIIDLYAEDMDYHSVSIDELKDIIDLFPIPELYTSDINEIILAIINHLHM